MMVRGVAGTGLATALGGAGFGRVAGLALLGVDDDGCGLGIARKKLSEVTKRGEFGAGAGFGAGAVAVTGAGAAGAGEGRCCRAGAAGVLACAQANTGIQKRARIAVTVLPDFDISPAFPPKTLMKPGINRLAACPGCTHSHTRQGVLPLKTH